VKGAEKKGMRFRFWIGLAAVLLIAAGSVVAAVLVHDNDDANFHAMQSDEASRAARQAESLAELSVGQLASAAASFQIAGRVDKHEFAVVSHSLLDQDVLTATALVDRVPGSQRAAYEREHGFPITERTSVLGLGPAKKRPVYYPLTYVGAHAESDQKRALGFDLGSDPGRAPYLNRARDGGTVVATPVIDLLLGGRGINVYKAIYRDQVPTKTEAERRRQLIGFAAGSIRVSDLASTIDKALPGSVVEQLQVGGRTITGPGGELEDAATAPVRVADRVWLLVVRDPNRPDVGLPIVLAAIGVALSALLGALIFIWSRNERFQELEREAGEDELTGLKNRRRFEEETRAAMARRRRDRQTGALLMLDLDHFKRVNDTHGHPAGDRLIREIAAVLRRRARESDVLARIGGDEFAMTLPRASANEAVLVAEAITNAIREHEPEGEGVETVTACVGVAIFGGELNVSFESLLSEADTAMYAAKDGGRDGVRVFDAGAIREDAPS
jgi:diguanylate cyclase (GGDEF)-like protein